jgi:methyl-accepting chemotaxis protein
MASRRKTIVINKKFQYQYSLLAVALTVLAVNLFVIFRMLSPGDNPLYISPGSALLIAAVELGLVAGVWYWCLKSSHRIAGPVYVFSREIAKLGNGDFTAFIRLRRKDMFQEEATHMNTSFAALRLKIESLKEIGQQLEQSPEDSAALTARLQEELASLTTEVVKT